MIETKEVISKAERLKEAGEKTGLTFRDLREIESLAWKCFLKDERRAA
jgi:hypothetical protein